MLKAGKKFRLRVCFILVDGEYYEGNVWEAYMSAAHHHPENLICIVGNNKAMGKGLVWNLMGIEPFSDKQKTFGWNVVQKVNVHDINELSKAFFRSHLVYGYRKTHVIIAHTLKGKGVERPNSITSGIPIVQHIVIRS